MSEISLAFDTSPPNVVVTRSRLRTGDFKLFNDEDYIPSKKESPKDHELDAELDSDDEEIAKQELPEEEELQPTTKKTRSGRVIKQTKKFELDVNPNDFKDDFDDDEYDSDESSVGSSVVYSSEEECEDEYDTDDSFINDSSEEEEYSESEEEEAEFSDESE